jgi:hypothetical protein
MDIPPKYWICLAEIKELIKSSKFDLFNSGKLSYLDVDWSQLEIKGILKQINKERAEKVKPQLSKGQNDSFKGKNEFFTDSDHPLFLPLLINYLAITENGKIIELLDFYFQNGDVEKQKADLTFLIEFLAPAFEQYRTTVSNISQKELIVKEWTQRFVPQEHLQEDVKLLTKKTKQPELFSIPTKKIESTVRNLVKIGTIDEASKDVLISFLNNDFSRQLDLKANQGQVGDLFLRMASNDKNVIVDKKRLAVAISDKVRFFKKNEFQTISYLENPRKLTP